MWRTIITMVLLISSNAYSQELYNDTLVSDTLKLDSTMTSSEDADTINIRSSITEAPASSLVDSLMIETRKRLELVNPVDSHHYTLMKEYDILIMRDWEVKVVRIKNIRPEGIEFLYPFNTSMQMANREKSSQILYATGKREVFYPLEIEDPNDSIHIKRVVVLDEKAWEKIIVAESIDEIPSEFTALKTVDTRVEGDRINTPNTKLETNALIILRRKSVNAGGSHLLISEKQFNRPYGDIPYLTIEGVVYGISHENEKE